MKWIIKEANFVNILFAICLKKRLGHYGLNEDQLKADFGWFIPNIIIIQSQLWCIYTDDTGIGQYWF